MEVLGQQATENRTEDCIMDITAEQRITWMERLLDEVLRTQGRSRATTNESTTQTEMTEEKENRHERRKKATYRPMTSTTVVEKDNYYEKYLTMKLKIEDKIKLCPYDVKRELDGKGGEEIESLVTAVIDSYTITTKNKEQSQKLRYLQEVCSVPCTITGHKYYNSSKVVIYVETYGMYTPGDFKREMINTYSSIVDITAANVIKPRIPNVKPLMVTFKAGEVPSYIGIPGEPVETKVVPFETRLKRCMNYQRYGHVKSRCSGTLRCGRCSQEGHTKQSCQAP